MAATDLDNNEAVKTYLALLKGREIVVPLDWETFLQIRAPYQDTPFTEREVQTRYFRNGYDWDIHGTLYTPATEILPDHAFVLIHGGGVNELDFQVTPDGRPGLARILASQGFTVLTPSYPGLFPPGGKWDVPVTSRKPFYLLDRNLADDEIKDRLLKATYGVYMQGIGSLVEQCLGNKKLFMVGHSTGGPMAADIYEYLVTAKVAGILGWGSGATDAWISKWRETTRLPKWAVGPPGAASPLGAIIYRSVEEYRGPSGYEDPPDLTPWGDMAQRFELVRETTPMFNPDLQVTSHDADMARLESYHRATGLPLQEYTGHLREPAPSFLREISVLLLVGENDKNHWKTGGERLEDKQDGFAVKLYAEKTNHAHLVLVPRYAHMGHWALHNEKLVYLWLWAVKCGYFDSP